MELQDSKRVPSFLRGRKWWCSKGISVFQVSHVKLQVCGRIVLLFLGNLMCAISDQNALAVPKSLKRYRRVSEYELPKEAACYLVKWQKISIFEIATWASSPEVRSYRTSIVGCYPQEHPGTVKLNRSDETQTSHREGKSSTQRTNLVDQDRNCTWHATCLGWIVGIIYWIYPTCFGTKISNVSCWNQTFVVGDCFGGPAICGNIHNVPDQTTFTLYFPHDLPERFPTCSPCFCSRIQNTRRKHVDISLNRSSTSQISRPIVPLVLEAPAKKKLGPLPLMKPTAMPVPEPSELMIFPHVGLASWPRGFGFGKVLR